ncbi:unnamed protein product [Leptosia nina]|uniref:Lipocalin/cytosolic fatty-acid binding domain-containing protein n=1 Tax=Leptosia nina TaxID=320188 RepID=A0AAV1JC74_9NEOP
MRKLLVLAAFFSGALSQLKLEGKCDLQALTNGAKIDMNRFSGVWYHIAKIPNWQYGECSSMTITMNSDSTNGEAVTNHVFSRKPYSWTARILANRPSDGIIEFAYPLHSRSYKAVVLATDYTGYALLHGCFEDSNNEKEVYSWQLSRTKTLSPAQTQSINAAIAKVPDYNNVRWFQIRHEQAYCTTDGPQPPPPRPPSPSPSHAATSGVTALIAPLALYHLLNSLRHL